MISPAVPVQLQPLMIHDETLYLILHIIYSTSVRKENLENTVGDVPRYLFMLPNVQIPVTGPLAIVSPL
jgi:hypothetical protein